MTAHTKRIVGLMAVLATVGLVALATPAQAVYIVTPLQLHVEDTQVDVGDAVNFTVSPQNETMAEEWAGRTVRVTYAWDRNEGEGAEGPDSATSNDSWSEVELLDALTLDESANATFTWTVPEDVQDRNVDVRVLDENGELLAVAHLAVGDAEPQMRILAGSGPAGGEPEPYNEGDDGTPSDASDVPTDEQTASDTDESPADGQSSVPGPGVLALAGTVAVAATAFAMARRDRS